VLTVLTAVHQGSTHGAATAATRATTPAAASHENEVGPAGRASGGGKQKYSCASRPIISAPRSGNPATAKAIAIPANVRRVRDAIVQKYQSRTLAKSRVDELHGVITRQPS
jgi:hypothetical protein